MTNRLRFREREDAAFAFECVNAAANVGSSFANKSIGFSVHREMFEFRNGGFATRNPRSQQLGICWLALRRARLFTCGVTEVYRLKNALKRGLDIFHLAKHDAFTEIGSLARTGGDVGLSFGRGVARELPQEFTERDQTLEISRVGENGRFCCGID